MFRRLSLMAALIALATVLLVCGCSKDCVECPKENPVLYLNKHKINLGETQTTSTLAISNKGQQTLSWTISISPSTAAAKLGDAEAGGWLTVTPLTGSGDGTITCTADRAKLDKLGISRAMLIIDAPDAANTTRDSVEVSIVQSNAWMIADDGVFDSCATATIDDYYWVKEFHLPTGVDAVIVDSISFYFCSGGETIQLLANDWTVTENDPERVKFPGQFLFISTPPYLETASGWNSYPVNWYISTDTFYLGYFQMGESSPGLKIDTSPSETENTGCWTARDVNTDPNTVELAWYLEGVSQTFAIRAHVTPTFQSVGKRNNGTSTTELWNTLELGYKQRGTRLTRICPPRHD
ncbi:MAG: hypothetical protein E4G91_08735 [Candidatus Zixiibacteriota bacterium]|nr:MAG: hypothetical protein E4G91_08735 [candidate division Zixibacteria bacterium]